MAHYAMIDENNMVTAVITGRNEDEIVDGISDWETYYGNQFGQACLRTSYNTWGNVHYDPTTGQPSDDQSKVFRYNYASPGYEYDPEADAFIPPAPHPSWVLDTVNYKWEAPLPLPADADTVAYYWDEDAGEWVAQTED